MKQETIEEAAELALLFHNTYEKLAPSFGYETRQDTKEFDFKSNNGKLMIAVCSEIIKWQQEQMYSEEKLDYFAIEFAAWCGFYCTKVALRGWQIKGSEGYKSTKELLEIFKKQKGYV